MNVETKRRSSLACLPAGRRRDGLFAGLSEARSDRHMQRVSGKVRTKGNKFQEENEQERDESAPVLFDPCRRRRRGPASGPAGRSLIPVLRIPLVSVRCHCCCISCTTCML
jgi:hypothetical protein